MQPFSIYPTNSAYAGEQKASRQKELNCSTVLHATKSLYIPLLKAGSLCNLHTIKLGNAAVHFKVASRRGNNEELLHALSRNRPFAKMKRLFRTPYQQQI